MKKITILFIVFLISFSNTYAQVPITLTYDGNDVTNSEILLLRDVSMEVHVTNSGSTDLDIVVEITEMNYPHKAPSWEVCWGDCFLPTGPMVLGMINVAAGATNTSDFHLVYHSDGNTDPANITFHLYEDGNVGDYVSLIMDTEHVGVQKIDAENLFTIYPNPATDYINIKSSAKTLGYKIIITNTLGNVISTTEINNENNIIPTDNLPGGIYFVSILNGKELLNTKKLIVN